MVQSLAPMVLQAMALALQLLHLADLWIPTHRQHHMALQQTHTLPSQAPMARQLTHMLTLRNNMVSMEQIHSALHYHPP